MLMHTIAQGCVQTLLESALKLVSGRKILFHTGELNPHQWCADPMLYQLSYIPSHADSCLALEGTTCEEALWAVSIGRPDQVILHFDLDCFT